MAMATLSPNSILATPVQLNPQVKSDLQTSGPQVAQDVQKSTKAIQTDTITISAQALKMADGKNTAAKETASRAEDQATLQLAGDKANAAKNEAQINAVKAYTVLSASQ